MKPSSSAGPASPNPIPPHWAWHHSALLRLRQTVLDAQAEHERAAKLPMEREGLDQAELAQEESEHDVILAELHAESDRLREIDAALQRLVDGTYGRCEETGVPISPARLRAIPWTRYSRASAARHETRPRSTASL